MDSRMERNRVSLLSYALCLLCHGYALEVGHSIGPQTRSTVQYHRFRRPGWRLQLSFNAIPTGPIQPVRSQSRDGSATLCANLRITSATIPRIRDSFRALPQTTTGRSTRRQVVERRSGGRRIMWTAAIHRRFAFGLMDLPARVRPPPPTTEAWRGPTRIRCRSRGRGIRFDPSAGLRARPKFATRVPEGTSKRYPHCDGPRSARNPGCETAFGRRRAPVRWSA